MAVAEEDRSPMRGLLDPRFPEEALAAGSARDTIVGGRAVGRRWHALSFVAAGVGAAMLLVWAFAPGPAALAAQRIPAGGGASSGRLIDLEEREDFDVALLSVHRRVWVQSQTGHRRECTIKEVDGTRVKVHYIGFPTNFDEWLERDSVRILSLGVTSSSTSTTTTTTTMTTSSSTETTTTATSSTSTTKTITTSTSTSTTTPRRYTSLFCFTLARSDNDELAIVRLQLEKGIGIFDCDGQMVFSDVQTWISEGPTFMRAGPFQAKQSPMLIETVPVPANLGDAQTNPFAQWINVKDYIECWSRLIADGRYRWFDFVAKVDPDTVFFPGRLRDRLRSAPVDKDTAAYYHTCKWAPRKCVHTVSIRRFGYPDWGFQVIGTSKDQFHVSGCDTSTEHGRYCQMKGWGNGENVIRNQEGHRVKGGNCCHDREEVKGVVSNCPQDQTESPESGMSGALEVLSRKAVELYGDRSQLCSANGYGDVGEEFFMQACMQMLQAKSIQGTDFLNDIYCGGAPNDCSTAEVAFHPFKTTTGYMQCVANAVQNLKVPELHKDLLQSQQADG